MFGLFGSLFGLWLVGLCLFDVFESLGCLVCVWFGFVWFGLLGLAWLEWLGFELAWFRVYFGVVVGVGLSLVLSLVLMLARISALCSLDLLLTCASA